MFVPRAEPIPPVPLVAQKGRPPKAESTATLRHCRRHGLVVFHYYRAGKRAARWRCKRCVGEAVTRRLQKVKRILVAEAGGCCAVCGYDRCMVNLHFHHVDPATKSFALSVATGKGLGQASRGGKEVRPRMRELSRRDREPPDPITATRCHVRCAYNRTPAQQPRGRGLAVKTPAFHAGNSRVRIPPPLLSRPRRPLRPQAAGRSSRTTRRRPAARRSCRPSGVVTSITISPATPPATAEKST